MTFLVAYDDILPECQLRGRRVKCTELLAHLIVTRKVRIVVSTI